MRRLRSCGCLVQGSHELPEANPTEVRMAGCEHSGKQHAYSSLPVAEESCRQSATDKVAGMSRAGDPNEGNGENESRAMKGTGWP